MGKLQAQLKKYYRDIKREIPKNYPGSTDIVNHIRQNIENFLDEQPNASFDDIISQFGNASEIVSSFIEDMPTEDITALLKKDRKKRYVTWVVCIFSIIIVSGICYYIYLLIVSTPVEITETTTIYYYEDTETTEPPVPMEEYEV